MTRKIFTISFLSIFVIGACAKSPPDIISEAHQAVLAVAQTASPKKFDDAFTQIFPEKGLVCGGRMGTADLYGKNAGYQRYYFSRTLGVALEGESPSWLPIANACIAAIRERLTVTNHRLNAEVSKVHRP